MARSKIRVASFFSGIGGFDLGFERAGLKIVMQCEINSFCNSVLTRHWSQVTRHEDIRKINSTNITPADVWVGGFPCQDVSVARMGPRAGLRGRQSGLFYRFAELIGECLPRTVVIENVPGLLSSHGGADFQIVIQTLADLGYSVGWRVLNSRYFGVPQSRQRVFIVGCYRDWQGVQEILFEPERSNWDTKTGKKNGEKPVSPFKEELGDTVEGPIVQGLAYCLYACAARHTGTDWSRTYVSYPDGRVRRLMPTECERIQGFPVDWTIPLEKYDDLDALDSLRYTALGNAVTVDVAEWLGRKVKAQIDSAQENPSKHVLSHTG